MANFGSARLELPDPDDLVDTVPDSYSITENTQHSLLNHPSEDSSDGIVWRRVANNPEEPSDWRIDFRPKGRPKRHWACPFFYLPVLYGYAFLGAWLFTMIEGRGKPHDSNSTSCESHPISDLLLDGLPYSVSVFTTVGYGVQSPKTVAGQIVTIFYAIFGIPLYFSFTSDFQDWVDQALFVWLYGFYLRVRNRIFKSQIAPGGKIARWKKFLWFLAISTSWLFIQGWITMLVQNGGHDSSDRWTYLSSMYFVFQSAALIGFGDLMTSRNLYLTVHFPMLVIGQVLLTGLFTAAIKYIRYKFPVWAVKLWTLTWAKLFAIARCCYCCGRRRQVQAASTAKVKDTSVNVDQQQQQARAKKVTWAKV